MPKHKAKAESSSSGSDKAEELSSSDSGPDDRAPAKKSKSDTKEKSSKSKDNDSWDLGKNRSVRLTEFNRKWYVDIREFYSADGELKPGRKGIMLTMEQWQKLKGQLNSIDDAIKKHV